MPSRAKTETASPGKTREFFPFAGDRVPPGTKRSFNLPVARLPTGTELSLPVTVVHGRRSGPVVWLSAAIHGDEINGIPIIRRVLRALRPKEMAGTLLVTPVVNVFGLINDSRYLPDRRDLNRAFPGSKRGSLASQLAHLFMQDIVARCEFGIDLHTGSGGRKNLPQIRCDLRDSITKRAALSFGTPIVIHSTLRDGSLRAAAGDLGIRVLLYEAGEASRFDDESIRCGVDGTLRVLSLLEMVEGEHDERSPVISHGSRWMRAPRGGFCEIEAPLGTRVEAGQVIARVFDTSSRADTPVKTRVGGIVIGTLQSALVNKGDAVVHVAEIDP